MQASRLTELSLKCPYPEDGWFFAHLAAATRLHSLSIEHSLTDQPAFTASEEAEALLGLALSRLTGLTALSLSGVCQHSVPDSVGAMAALQARGPGPAVGLAWRRGAGNACTHRLCPALGRPQLE